MRVRELSELPPRLVDMEFHLSWPGHDVVFDAADVVVSKLAELDAEFAAENRSVFVGIDADEVSLDAGVGVQHALVSVSDEVSPGYVSRGVSQSAEIHTFEFDDDQIEIPASNLIEGPAALAAVAEFVTTLARPTNVDWDEF